MRRRHFSERAVIETLLRQGAIILCYRTKQKVQIGDVIEREHITPLALGGADIPENCAYSLKTAHARQTFGSKATTSGSDVHAIAKAKRLERERKGEAKRNLVKRKIPSRPFPSVHRPIRAARENALRNDPKKGPL